MSERSCTCGASPLAFRCSTHLVQHPQDGSLYTVIVTGLAAAVLSAGTRPTSAAPPHTMPAARAIHSRRFNELSSIIALLLVHPEMRGTRCPRGARAQYPGNLLGFG